MATPPDAVRVQLATVTAAAAAEVTEAAQQAPVGQQVGTALAALPLVIPSYYDAAGALAVSWYDELRDASRPSSAFLPAVVGEPSTDWIDREVAKFASTVEADLEEGLQRVLDEVAHLAEKEVARGYRATIIGNAHVDEDAVGWSRVARPGACKLCRMLADRGAVYRKETANFAAHTDCHCAARAEFRNGAHGPEATVEQYLASTKNRTPKQRAQLREYLNLHFPDAPG